MKTTKTGVGARRLIATLGAIALGLTGAIALASPANAAVPDGPANMPTQNGSITVHKYVQPDDPTGLPHDGTAIDPSLLTGLTPLQGVVYKVQPVQNIDLSTNAGWAIVTGPPMLTPADVGNATYPLGAGTSVATDVNGAAAFTNLPIGVYLVSETSAGGNQIPQLADPFLVTIPLPSGTGTWLTDVNVYPKNPLTEVHKTVNDAGAHVLGDTVNWSITAKVPNLADGQDLTSFAISDELDARLTYVPTATVSFSGAALAPADYTITPPAAAGGTLTVTFNASGIAKLKAHQGDTVTVGIATTVTSIGSGTIENSGVVNINGSSFTSTPVKTTWGALKIVKVADGTQSPLKGADFAVYTSAADALAGTGAVATGTSDDNGVIQINGLKAQNNGTGDNLDYYVVETKAPSGYTVNPAYTPANPTKVTITPGTIAQAQVLTVTDKQVLPFILPLTGSTGNALFIGGGIALIVLAIGAAFVAYRRKAQVVQD